MKDLACRAGGGGRSSAACVLLVWLDRACISFRESGYQLRSSRLGNGLGNLAAPLKTGNRFFPPYVWRVPTLRSDLRSTLLTTMMMTITNKMVYFHLLAYLFPPLLSPTLFQLSPFPTHHCVHDLSTGHDRTDWCPRSGSPFPPTWTSGGCLCSCSWARSSRAGWWWPGATGGCRRTLSRTRNVLTLAGNNSPPVPIVVLRALCRGRLF